MLWPMAITASQSRTNARMKPSYAADDVFDALASDILRGKYVPESPLPPERILSERFGVSKVLVRQAIHRLAKARLVRVRQGEVTRVLDPENAHGLAVIELFYRLSVERRSTLAKHVLEKQYTQGLSLLEVFERRASVRDRRGLRQIVESASVSTEAELALFQQAFWTACALGGGNRILIAEVRWWYEDLPAPPLMPASASVAVRLAFYVELARRLNKRANAAAYYVTVLQPSIDALFGQGKP
jgi:GntR family transcriptional regulator, transcriptional repressor for pyruvate dehydrogenase complex